MDVQVPTTRRTVAGALVAVVLVVAVVVSPTTVLAPIETLAAHPIPFALALLALYLVRPFIAVPTMLCSAVVGYGYGLYGLPLAIFGAALTSLPPFYLTRWTLGEGSGGEDRAEAFAGFPWSTDRVRRAGEEFFETTGGVRGVTAARLAPIPADLVTCGAAASRVSVGALFAGTLVGELPWTVGAVLVGASAGKLTALGDVRAVGTPVVLAGLGIAVLLVAGPTYRYLRDRRATDG